MTVQDKLQMIRENVIKAKEKSNAPARGPVDVVAMAKQLGFAVLSTPALPTEIIGVMYLNLTGQFSQDLGSRKLIALNENFDDKHQRFAIAHEIGHFFMHDNDCKEDDWEHAYTMTQDDEKGIEGEACRFAAMLLMEERSFRQSFNELKKDNNNEAIDIIEKLSNKFKAPQSSVKRRISELKMSYD